MGGGGGNSKKVLVDFGNFRAGIDFFRPKILTHFSGFSLELRNNFNFGEHFSKLVLNCCVSGPKLLRASVNLASAQQFRT